MQGLDVRNIISFANIAEGSRRVLEQLRFPLRNKVGMNVEFFRQLRLGELTANCKKRYFRFECR